MTLLVSILSALAASWSHLTDVNPALTADGKPGFCIHDYILRCFNWIYLAAEIWDGHQDVCDGWRKPQNMSNISPKPMLQL